VEKTAKRLLAACAVATAVVVGGAPSAHAVEAAAAGILAAPAGCPSGYVCMYKDAGFKGGVLAKYLPATARSLPAGISSIYNNATAARPKSTASFKRTTTDGSYIDVPSRGGNVDSMDSRWNDKVRYLSWPFG
jgi:hypothetical protein